MLGNIDTKRDTNFRWVLLCFSVFGGFVFAYSYDTPASIKDLLFEHFKSQYTEDEFEMRYSLLYSLMALPDIFMSLFLGFLIDKFRVRVNFWVLSIVVAIGTTVTYFGVANTNFFMMCAGRFLLGASGESIHIVEGLFLRMYFNNNEMSFIIAIVESFLSMGGFLAFLVSPRIAAHNMIMTFAIANYMCIVNAVFVIFVCLYDKWFESKNPRAFTISHYDEEQDKLTQNLEYSEEPSSALKSPEKIYEQVETPVVPLPEQNEEEGDEQYNEAEPEDLEQSPATFPSPFTPRDPKKGYFARILDFPASYWYLLIAGATVLSSIQSFLMIGSSYILDKGILPGDLEAASIRAATYVSLFRLTAAVTLPFFGYLIDVTGKRQLWLLVGTLLTVTNHILIIFIHPLPCCILYGCCYAIVAAALWPSIYFIIPKRLLGIATAMVSCIDNIGLMIYPAINGIIRAKTGSYDNAMIFLAVMTFLASFAAYQSYRLLKKEPHRKGSLVLSRKSSIVLKEYEEMEFESAKKRSSKTV